MNFDFKEKPSIIVSDFDDVLCYMTPKWFDKIMQNREIFENHLNLPKKYNKVMSNNILLRDEFYFDGFLFKKDVKFSDEEIIDIKNKMYELYVNDRNFYDDLLPSAMGRSLSLALGQSMVEKLYVVTRSSPNHHQTKETFIHRLFANNMDKVEIVYIDIDRNEKKSDFIKNLPRVDMLLEDELKNIYDILENCNNVKNMDIYIPSCGYNKPTSKLRELVDKNQNTLTYYSLT